jgi:type II secretory pathway pseudopilin PulG
MLTTVAVLIIVLGLMVSLARHVRDRSAQQLTRNLLRQLDELMTQYASDDPTRLPHVTPVIPEESVVADETTIRTRARPNNEDFVRALRAEIARARLRAAAQKKDQAADRFGELPISAYDEVTLRDAWGSPIVFMARENRSIGMAPGGRWFFFSAGPDRLFLSRDDNLYSYESPGAGTK